MPSTYAYVSGFVCTVVLYLHFIQPLSLPSFIPSDGQYAIQFFLKFTAWVIFVLHSLESLYTFHLCRKHSTGLLVGVSSDPNFLPLLDYWWFLNPYPGTVCSIYIRLWNANLAKYEKAHPGSANRLGDEDPVVWYFVCTSLNYFTLTIIYARHSCNSNVVTYQ